MDARATTSADARVGDAQPPGTKAGRRGGALPRVALDLTAIEAALRDVQRDFAHINASLDTPRDVLGDEVLANLLAAYGYLGRLLEDGIDPLARGNSRHLLKLNLLVLFGERPPASQEGEAQVRETERRFYDDSSPGSLRALVNWLADHAGDNVWRRAAGAYIQVLSAPQLFLEGNHRTGALIASALLCGAGQPPFVLTVGNAKAWFDPSSLVKGCRKRSLKALLAIPKLRKRLAKVLRDEANPRFLRERDSRQLIRIPGQRGKAADQRDRP